MFMALFLILILSHNRRSRYKYGVILGLVFDRYEHNLLIDKLLNTIREKLNNDFGFYDRLKEVL